MNKSKIPVLSEGLGRSVKDKKIMLVKGNKPQIKFPSKLQAPSFKPKLSTAKPATAISEVMVNKYSKEILFKNKRMKNSSECPRVKLIKEQKSTLKTEAASKPLKKSTGKVSSDIAERLPVNSTTSSQQDKYQKKIRPKTVSKTEAASKPFKKSTGKVSSDIAERLPINSNTSSQQDKYQKKSRPKTVSKQKLINQKPQSIKGSDCLKEPNPVIKAHRIAVKESVICKAKIPTKLKENESNLDENDIEFQASGFYKKLILAEKELSPEIIKLCANKKISSMLAHLDSPGKELLMKNPSVDHFVEDFKRNSAMFHRLIGKFPNSPYWSDKGSSFKRTPCHLFSTKQNLEKHDLGRQIRKESELRNVVLEKSHLTEAASKPLKKSTGKVSSDITERLPVNSTTSSQQDKYHKKIRPKTVSKESFNPNCRRWTTNTPRKFEVSADTVRRLSEVRKDSGLPVSVKSIKRATCYELECLNPHERVLRELNNLTVKKKVKSKKKVTFDIPKSSPTTVEISKATSNNNLECGLATILDSSSKVSTPELNSDKSKDSVSNDNKETCENPPQVTTPELHLNPSRINASLLPLEKESGYEQRDQAKITTPELNLLSFKNLPSEIDLETYNFSVKDNVHIPTTCLIQSKENIAITSISEQLNQAEECYSISEKNIYTPGPISLYSNLANDVSPLFLTRKSTNICSYVPIYTPYALKSLAKSERSSLSPVCQRLQFKDDSELSIERRKSQIYIQNIPTLQKTYDYLCDQECSIFSSQSATIQLTRNLNNPVASVLNEGDQMHFLPIRLSSEFVLL